MRGSRSITVLALALTGLLVGGALGRSGGLARSPNHAVALGVVSVALLVLVIAGLRGRTATPYW